MQSLLYIEHQQKSHDCGSDAQRVGKPVRQTMKPRKALDDNGAAGVFIGHRRELVLRSTP